MENAYDPWEMFHSTDMGKNLEEIVETMECKILRMRESGGKIVQSGTHEPCAAGWKV